jgi:hypothetical protein
MVTNTNVSSNELKSALTGVNYPADKQTLLKRIKKQGSDEIISALNGLPDRQYTDETDVLMELGVDDSSNMNSMGMNSDGMNESGGMNSDNTTI